MNNIIKDELELSKAANAIVNYADFLSDSIAAYINILADVQTKGINDNLVCDKLSDLRQELKNYDRTILDICSELSSYVSKDMSEIEAADNFEFPNELPSSISNLLAKFL